MKKILFLMLFLLISNIAIAIEVEYIYKFNQMNYNIQAYELSKSLREKYSLKLKDIEVDNNIIYILENYELTSEVLINIQNEANLLQSIKDNK